MLRIEDWFMVVDVDPYKPPEMQIACLQGFAYGHPRFDDGMFITTSRLVDLDIPNAIAKTCSGHSYQLGKPDSKWVEWLKDNGFVQHVEDLEKLTSHILN